MSAPASPSLPPAPAARPPVRIADADGIAAAAAALRDGRLVAMPTETVYGLAADATSDAAVAAIFAAKGRPAFNPLIVHVRDAADAARLVVIPPPARAMIERFWPGPLTLVLPRRGDCPVSVLASAGLPTLGVRAPDHPAAQALIAAAGCPLAAPSANRSGRLSPTSADAVADSLGADVALVLDAGPCRVGLESTILGFDDAGRPVLLRPGGIPRAAIEAVTGPLGQPGEDAHAPAAPGRLASHYAPVKPLRLDVTAPNADEAFLGFAGADPGPARVALDLSPEGDLGEAAVNLFAMLRALDASQASAIAVAPIPRAGLGEAINDRLARAAAPR